MNSVLCTVHKAEDDHPKLSEFSRLELDVLQGAILCFEISVCGPMFLWLMGKKVYLSRVHQMCVNHQPLVGVFPKMTW